VVAAVRVVGYWVYALVSAIFKGTQTCRLRECAGMSPEEPAMSLGGGQGSSAVNTRPDLSSRPRPWAALSALVGAVGLLMWLPSWSLAGVVAPVGMILAALGWRSAPRRWLLWLAFVLNGLLLLVTALAWISWSRGD
jgi:hypothetical protein